MVALSKSVYGVVVNPYKDLIPPSKSEVPLSKVVYMSVVPMVKEAYWVVFTMVNVEVAISNEV